MLISRRNTGSSGNGRPVVALQHLRQGLYAVVLFVAGVQYALLFLTARPPPSARALLRAAAAAAADAAPFPTAFQIRPTLLRLPGVSAELVWDQLVREGAHLLSRSNNNTRPTVGVAMEVGMHRAAQCLQAAAAGFQVHCVEPSPVSFRRVEAKVRTADRAVQQRTFLYQAAAAAGGGSESSPATTTVSFTGSGGTGDHVGDFDVWNMRPGPPTDAKLAVKHGEVVEVATISLDEIIAHRLRDGQDAAFVVKVDTQGYEPAVVSGLARSLAAHKVQFLLLEYWPHGMDLLAHQPAGTCLAANLVRQLLGAGYAVYALPASAHPAAPVEAQRAIRDPAAMPLHDATAHCQWFYELERRYPSETYKMGYWADILAVAPNVQLAAVTDLGAALMADRRLK